MEALSVIEDVEPSIPGINFRVAHLTQPVMIARNETRHPLVIFGRNGEPFLRIAAGRVASNAHSPLTYSTRSPSSHFVTPDDIDLDAPPLWRHVGRGKSWSWFDPRIRRDSAGAEQWTIVAGWRGRKISITGGFESFEGHGHFDTAIESLAAVEGLDVEMHDGLVPAIFVRNETSRVLRVSGRAGEPFLRIGPRGVHGNRESPDLYLGGAQTIRPVPRGVDPADPPRWTKLSSVPIWTWLEFRARLPESASLRSNLGDERRAVLRWKTPMTLGGSDYGLEGVVHWIPPVPVEATAHRRDAGPILKLAFYAVGTGAAIAFGVSAYRRRRRLAR